MAWSTVTLSTLNSIAQYEAEINAMAGTYTRHTLLLQAGGSVYITAPITGDIVIATYVDGTTETLENAGHYVHTVTTGGLAVKLSWTNVGGAAYTIPLVSGSGDAYDTTGTYYLDLSECVSVSWNSSIVQTSWEDKCILSKQQIGDEIKKLLAQKGWRDDDVDSGEILDYVSNTTALVTAADYLTLHLIYIDLFATQPTESYKDKADYYAMQYEKALQKALYQITFAISGDAYPLFDTYGSRLQV